MDEKTPPEIPISEPTLFNLYSEFNEYSHSQFTNFPTANQVFSTQIQPENSKSSKI